MSGDCDTMIDGVIDDPFMGISKSECINDGRCNDLFWLGGPVSACYNLRKHLS